jgi:hypothetical protein
MFQLGLESGDEGILCLDHHVILLRLELEPNRESHRSSSCLTVGWS